jgi:hypothetical protein
VKTTSNQGDRLQGVPENDTPLDGIEALRQAAKRAVLQESLRALWQRGANYPQKRLDSSHAAPLSPLRQRDQMALSELFDRKDMYDVEADVAQNLLKLMPEPCWEDDPLKSMQEFL